MKFTPIKPNIECSIKSKHSKINPLIIRKKCLEYLKLLTSEASKELPSYIIEPQQSAVINELYWNQQGRKVIFVDSPELIQCILNSKFDVDVVKNLQPLSDSFMLVLPTNISNQDNYILPNTLVSCFSSGREAVNSNIGFAKDIGLNHISADDILAKTEKAVIDLPTTSIVYNFDDGMGVDAISEKYYAHTLNKKATRSPNNDPFYNPNNDPLFCAKKVSLSGSLLKLILGLSIYISAGGIIRNGVPNLKAKAMRNSVTTGMTISLDDKLKKNIHKDGFLRGFFFRNLRDTKYYQGKYASLPPDSRWTFVKPHWVGNPISPSTIEYPK